MKIIKSKRFGLILISIIITLFASLIFCVGFAYAKSSDFKSGEGTESDPFIISTPEELNMVRYHSDAYFLQTANLDMSEIGAFVPIGSSTFPFTGHYNGGKYSITNLTIDSDENNVGLFSVLYNGSVENLKIKNSNVTGSYNVGAITGINKGIVRGCIVDASVSGAGSVGGVAGLNSTGGILSECGNLATVKCDGGIYAGGIAGLNDSVIENSYNRGNVNVGLNNAVYSGGIAGYNHGDNAVIRKSYATGFVDGKAKGRIAGDNNGIINACIFETGNYNLVTSFDNGQIIDTNGIAKDDFAKAESFGLWKDFNKLWMYIEGGKYPTLAREYVPVESVEFEDKHKIELQPGESYTFGAAVKPVHATMQNIAYEIVDNNDLAEFDPKSKIIKIKSTAEIGGRITVKAIAEGHIAYLEIEVVKIPVQRINITSVTGRTSVSAASGLAFGAEIFPQTASYKEVIFSVNSSYAVISDSGILTVKDDAPIGTSLIVTATSKDNRNVFDSMTITVVGVPVESVDITCDNSFKVTETLKLTADIKPSNATNQNVSYQILSSKAKGARLMGDNLYAEGIGKVVIVAKADGVSSKTFTVNVLKEPVSEIVFDTAGSFICGNGSVLYAEALPYNATYRQIAFEIIENNAAAEIIDGVLYAKRDGTVVVRATADGVSIDKTITVIKISVEAISFHCVDSLKHTESLSLNVSVKPNNATYKDIEYSFIENTAGAYIESGILYAEKPGTVTVRAVADGVSTEKTITVLKESVTNVTLTADYVDDERGEALQFHAAVYPHNATYQEVSYILKSGPATFTADGYLLIDITAPVGSLIEVYAVADGVTSAVYEIRSGKIAVKNVTLETDVSAIKVGRGAQLSVSTNPSQVSNPGVTFVTDGNSEVIEGVLYVNDPAMIGKTVTVTAIVDGVSSNAITILVEKTSVQAVGFTCGTSFKITESLALSAKVYPEDATNPEVTYSIVSDGKSGAAIIDGYLYADRPGVIKIRATADGVSRELIVHALKEPVRDVILTSVKSIKVNHELNLTSIVYPFNATYRSVRYELIDNAIGAEIWDGNVFYSSNVGTVTVRLCADDVYSDFKIEVTKEPVVDIKMTNKTFKHTERLKLDSYVIPFNATYNNVSYEIIRGSEFAYISENYLYASNPGTVTLRLTADGYSVEYDVKVLKNPVTGVDFDGADTFVLSTGYHVGEIGLNSIVFPSNATYREVGYEIVDSYNCAAEITNGILRVTSLETVVVDSNGYAKTEQGTVTVRATADGVYTDRTFVVCKKQVEDITITQGLQISPLTNGDWNYTESREFKTSGKMRFSVNMLSEYATYKDFIVEIGGVKLLPDADGKFTISADEPCVITVKITALCNGFNREFDFTVTEEKVDRVYLGTEISVDNEKIKKELRGNIEASANSPIGDAQYYKNYSLLEVQQASEINIRAFASAANPNLLATYGSLKDLVLYYEINGDAYQFGNGESNAYFKYNGDILTVKLDAPVNKSFYLYAKSKDGTVISEKTQIIAQCKYITEIREAYIDGDGVIRGLENLYQSDTNTSIIQKVSVNIKHTSGIEIDKTIITKDPTMRLQLYNPSLGGSFTIRYTVYFMENGNEYNYTLAGVNTFSGINVSSSYQSPETTYNSIVLCDFNSATTTLSMKTESNIKALYIYGAGAKINATLDIATNTENDTDLYLNNISLSAPDNAIAISIRNSGTLNLHTYSFVSIEGGNGVGDSANGCNAISAYSAKLNIFNKGRLIIKGGKGSTGASGTSYNGYTDPGSGKGKSPSGTAGDAGGDGGQGIYAYELAILGNENEITIIGGNGGDGGNGGNGSGSDRDGRPDAGSGGDGGRGGDGGTAIVVGYVLQLNLNTKPLTIQGGDAGHGGYAGNGGHALREHYSDNGGSGGRGGDGGNGGSGIRASTITGIIAGNIGITTGNGGRGRDGGSGGNGCDSWGKSKNGRGGDGGDAGNSGDGIWVEYESIDLSPLDSKISIAGINSAGSIGANGSGNAKAATGERSSGKTGTQGSKLKRN